MGALRAAELAKYGMEGVGWVFEAYRSGRIEADDEVAVSYSPEDLRCLTVPLVNVRRWLDELTASGNIDALTARRLFRRARQMFYADRTEERLWEAWGQFLVTPGLERLLALTDGQITDVKADDARLTLEMLAGSHDIPTRQEGQSWKPVRNRARR